MVQLIFNDEFNDLIEEPISYWKTSDDIPQNIKDFIIETSNSISIFDEKNNKYYCPKCIKEITEQNKCLECSRKFTFNNKLKIEDIKEIRHFKSNIYYYVFDIIEDYLCRGFNILTLHCTALVGDAYGKIDLSKRTIPITSKGGQIILSYMRRTKEQNPLYEHFDKVLKIFKEHKAVISLGPTYRPASVYDNSLDERDPYWEEVYRMSTLVEKAIQADVPIIVEGIGHARIDYIPTYVMKTKHLCHNAPYRVLTVSTDIALGYDHIASAIASSIAVLSGGDIITAVTPSEHIGIPSTMDIQDGVISARIAAHSAELCKGAAIKEDYRMSCIRNKCCSCHGDAKYAIFQKGAENRIGCGVQEAGCSMCGELCALKNKLAKENKID